MYVHVCMTLVPTHDFHYVTIITSVDSSLHWLGSQYILEPCNVHVHVDVDVDYIRKVVNRYIIHVHLHLVHTCILLLTYTCIYTCYTYMLYTL